MLLSRFHPKFPDSDIFFPKTWPFLSTTDFLVQARRFFSATFYWSSSDFGGNAEFREAVEIPTSFCNVRRHFSCCLPTVSPVAALWLLRDWLVHRHADVFWLF